MVYVDGFLSAVPTANKEAYLRHAENAARVFRDHGALSVVECWGDDVPEVGGGWRCFWSFATAGRWRPSRRT